MPGDRDRHSMSGGSRPLCAIGTSTGTINYTHHWKRKALVHLIKLNRRGREQWCFRDRRLHRSGASCVATCSCLILYRNFLIRKKIDDNLSHIGLIVSGASEVSPRGTTRCRLLRGSRPGHPRSTMSDSAGGGHSGPSICLTNHTNMLPRKTTSRSGLKVLLASSAVLLSSSAKADRAAGTISPVGLSATLLRLTDARCPSSRPCTLQKSLQRQTALPVPCMVQAIAYRTTMPMPSPQNFISAAWGPADAESHLQPATNGQAARV